jgi:hypothetical protein
MEKLINMCYYTDEPDNVRVCIIQCKDAITINVDNMYCAMEMLRSFPSEQIDGAAVLYDDNGEHFKLEWHK